MKTLNQWMAGALLVALSVSASSAGVVQDGQAPTKRSFAAVVYPAKSCKMWLCLEKYQPGAKIRVELINKQGNVVFGEGLPKKGDKFRQSFDLSEVGDGTYTFRVSDGTQTEEFAFNVSTPTVEQVPTRLISLK